MDHPKKNLFGIAAWGFPDQEIERFFFLQNWKFILLKIGKKSQWTLSIIKVLYNPKQILGFFRSCGIAYNFDPLFDISIDIILSRHVSQFLCLLRTRGNGDIIIYKGWYVMPYKSYWNTYFQYQNTHVFLNLSILPIFEHFLTIY